MKNIKINKLNDKSSLKLKNLSDLKGIINKENSDEVKFISKVQ